MDDYVRGASGSQDVFATMAARLAEQKLKEDEYAKKWSGLLGSPTGLEAGLDPYGTTPDSRMKSDPYRTTDDSSDPKYAMAQVGAPQTGIDYEALNRQAEGEVRASNAGLAKAALGSGKQTDSPSGGGDWLTPDGTAEAQRQRDDANVRDQQESDLADLKRKQEQEAGDKAANAYAKSVDAQDAAYMKEWSQSPQENPLTRAQWDSGERNQGVFTPDSQSRAGRRSVQSSPYLGVMPGAEVNSSVGPYQQKLQDSTRDLAAQRMSSAPRSQEPDYSVLKTLAPGTAMGGLTANMPGIQPTPVAGTTPLGSGLPQLPRLPSLPQLGDQLQFNPYRRLT